MLSDAERMALVSRAIGPSAAVHVPGELATDGQRPNVERQAKAEPAPIWDDRQLIDATLRGEREAFGGLVRRYQDRLVSSLAYVMGSADDAHDIAQDAFLQAFVKLSTFQGNSLFFTWLYRIAFNLSVSRRRREKTALSIDYFRTAVGEEPAAADVRPDQRCQREEEAAQVHAALALLSEEHRAVLVLRDFNDRSYDEIAQILEIPVGTVRSRIHRARSEMKQHLHSLDNG